MKPAALCAMLAMTTWLTVFAFAARAAEWHVAPEGKPDGDGTRARPWDLVTALRHPPAVQPGDVIWLHGGTYWGEKRETFTSWLVGMPKKPIIVRQFPGERATISPTLTIDSPPGGAPPGHVWFWGFEVFNPDTKEYERTDHSRWPCVWLRACRGVKLINLVIHGGGQGIGAWQDAHDLEICGCIIYHNGWTGSNQGHGIYTQNKEGTEVIRDNFIFHQLGTGYGIHAYGSAKAFVNNFVFEGNVAFCNQGNNILIGGGSPSERIVVRQNFAYAGNGVRIGYTAHNRDAVVEDNYFASHCRVNNWDEFTFRRNIIVAAAPIALDVKMLPRLPRYEWDDNTYYCTRASATPFTLVGADRSASLSFAQWREQTGFDAGSTFIATRPQGTKVFVRPHPYEQGRANIIVFNWDNHDAVDVDLGAILAPGDAYEVRDVQNWFGKPVAAGVWRGGAIRIPMRLTEVELPVTRAEFKHTPPEFGAFVLLRTNR